jgi:hypothetical protein
VNRRREIESSRLNTCANFILPMVDINHKTLPKPQFINCYIDNEYHIYLIFDKDEDFEELSQGFLNYIKEDNEYIVSCEEETDEYIIKFKIPQESESDFDYYLKGSYSKFDETYKNKLLLYFGRNSSKGENSDGLPLVNIINIIYPENIKRLQIAKRLDVDVSLIHEVFDPPDLTINIYKPIDKLVKDKYEQTIQDRI